MWMRMIDWVIFGRFWPVLVGVFFIVVILGFLLSLLDGDLAGKKSSVVWVSYSAYCFLLLIRHRYTLIDCSELDPIKVRCLFILTCLLRYVDRSIHC